MRFIGKTTRLLWALLIAVLVVPVLPMAGGRDSGELLSAAPADADIITFNCGTFGFDLIPDSVTYAKPAVIPAFYFKSDQSAGLASQAVIDIRWTNWGIAPDDEYGYGRDSYSFQFSPLTTERYFRGPPILTGKGDVTAVITGYMTFPYRTILGVPVPNCYLIENSAEATPGKSDPYPGERKITLPNISDPGLAADSGYYSDNKHCESCDKKEDMAAEQAMFDDRDAICDRIRKQPNEGGYDKFRLCKLSGLMVIRGSESDGVGTRWWKWVQANKNGWVGATDGGAQACYNGRCLPLGVNSAMSYCNTCADPYKRLPAPHISFSNSAMQGNRPPPDPGNGPQVWSPDYIWPDFNDHPALKRPPDENGDGPKEKPPAGDDGKIRHPHRVPKAVGFGLIDDILEAISD